MTSRHTITIIECIKCFQEQHGVHHDKWLHSKKTYDSLNTILSNEDNFEYNKSGSMFFKQDGYGGTLFCLVSEDTFKDIVNSVEYQVLKPIYKNIQATKNKELLDRISKLQSLDPQLKQNDDRDIDLKYMRVFVKYALEKPYDDSDYGEFHKFIIAHRKDREFKEFTSMCVIS